MISRINPWSYSVAKAAVFVLLTSTMWMNCHRSAHAALLQVEVKGEIQQDGDTKAEQEQDDDQDSTQDVSTGLDFLNAGTAPNSIDQLRAMEAHVAQLAEDVKPATVNIRVGQGQGSGVVISSDGYILTAAHVIGTPGQTALVTFPDGKQVRAETLGTNPGQIDSGILKIKDGQGEDWPYVDMGESSTLKPGQWLVAIGHPGGYNSKRGLVLRVGRLVFSDNTKLRTDCTLVGGDSGGPLFDMDGYVVGIHSRIGGSLADNLHVPVDQFSDEWDMLAGGNVMGGKAGMGFSVRRNTNIVSNVSRFSPAARAGMKTGDVVIKVQDEKTKNKNEVLAQLKELEAGQRITLTVKRKLPKKKAAKKEDKKSDDDKSDKETESKDSDESDSDSKKDSKDEKEAEKDDADDEDQFEEIELEIIVRLR